MSMRISLSEEAPRLQDELPRSSTSMANRPTIHPSQIRSKIIDAAVASQMRTSCPE